MSGALSGMIKHQDIDGFLRDQMGNTVVENLHE